MSYQSPFSNRYGSHEMRTLWSEKARRILWRRIWIAVAQAQNQAGHVTDEQLMDIKSQSTRIDLARAREIEAEIGHDLVAELTTFAEQSPIGGGILHWGMTSADVQDNADIIRQKASLALLLKNLKKNLIRFADQIEANADLTVMGYTHLQQAEPTTLGYRLSLYAQDLLAHFENLARLRSGIKGKGFRGPVGTAASFHELLEDSELDPETMELEVLASLSIEAHFITAQTYPRVQDFTVLSSLAALSASLHKFALDLRFLQSPGISTMAEPFGDFQVGSSAMPFKRNPIRAEKICSLAREVVAASGVAWQNAANSILERTLDDSANRRTILPEAFLACDEMLTESYKIIDGLVIDKRAIDATLTESGPFSATERLLNALVIAGADRQEMHEHLRKHSMTAWEAVHHGGENPLPDLLSSDITILNHLQPTKVMDLMDIRTYVGSAPNRAREMAEHIHQRFSPSEQSEDES
jgi:adenylosuccinate lyase